MHALGGLAMTKRSPSWEEIATGFLRKPSQWKRESVDNDMEKFELKEL